MVALLSENNSRTHHIQCADMTASRRRDEAVRRCIARYNYREAWLTQRIPEGTAHGDRTLSSAVLEAQQGHLYATCVMNDTDVMFSLGLAITEGMEIHQRVFPRESASEILLFLSMLWRFSQAGNTVHFWANATFFHEYGISQVRTFLNKHDTVFCGDIIMIERQILNFYRENGGTSEYLERAEACGNPIDQCLYRREALESGCWNLLTLMFSQSFNSPVRRFALP